MDKIKLPAHLLDTLRTLRIKSGLTQKAASNKLGIHETTLRSWEKDSSNIGYSDIQKIESVYGIEQEYIFFGKESAFSELFRIHRNKQHTA